MATQKTHEPRTLDAADYWQIRALEGDRAAVQAEANARMAALNVKRTALYKRLDLSLDTDYALNDDACTITVVERD